MGAENSFVQQLADGLWYNYGSSNLYGLAGDRDWDIPLQYGYQALNYGVQNWLNPWIEQKRQARLDAKAKADGTKAGQEGNVTSSNSVSGNGAPSSQVTSANAVQGQAATDMTLWNQYKQGQSIGMQLPGINQNAQPTPFPELIDWQNPSIQDKLKINQTGTAQPFQTPSFDSANLQTSNIPSSTVQTTNIQSSTPVSSYAPSLSDISGKGIGLQMPEFDYQLTPPQVQQPGGSTVTGNGSGGTGGGNEGGGNGGSNFKADATSTAGGFLGGAMLGNASNAVFSKIFGNKPGGQFMSNTVSMLASNIGSKMGSTIASNIGKGVGAFKNIGSGMKGMFSGGAGASMGMGLLNMGLDTFDPVKKSGWEQGVSAGLSVLGNVPVVGMAAQALNTVFNLASHIGAEKTMEHHADKELLDKTGGHYAGSVDKDLKAESMAGVKYSAFNKKALRKADAFIMEARKQEQGMRDVIGYQDLRSDITSGTTAINQIRRQQQMDGTYNPYVSLGRQGMVLEMGRKMLKDIRKFQEGGKDSEIWSLDPNTMQPGNVERQRPMFELIDDAKKQNPRFIQRLSETPKGIWVNKDGEDIHGSHLLSSLEQDGIGYVYPQIMEDEEGNLKYYGDTAFDEARKRGDVLKFSPNEAIRFAKSNSIMQGYKMGWPWYFMDSIWQEEKPKEQMSYIELMNPANVKDDEDVEMFKDGGEMNVIPEGALHARKHNMEMEGITKKGIPVVTCEGEEQQAEIERGEIVLRLEVTKKIEELGKQYQEGDQNTKDAVSLEIGKLLVDEILNNTIDNTKSLL